VGEHAAHDRERTTHQLLDQHFPLSRYSAEDRLQVLLFHLRARAGAEDATFRRTCTEILGTPEPVISAILHGDIPALYTALKEGGGWPVLASLLAYGDGLAADYGALVAAQAEYEELDMDPTQRRRLPMSRSMLETRGYQHSAETFLDDLAAAATDPRRLVTHEELIEALKCLRIRAGDPSLRDIADRSLYLPEGVDPTKHQHRSYNTLNKVLKVDATGPQLVPVLAFVRGCGVVDPEELLAWERACVRIAIAKRKASQEGRSPTGPNPSLA
jgi:hypothetical protein